MRPDAAGKLYRRVPPSSADIDDPVAALHRKPEKYGLTVMGEPAHQDLAEPVELWSRNFVPELDELRISFSLGQLCLCVCAMMFLP